MDSKLHFTKVFTVNLLLSICVTLLIIFTTIGVHGKVEYSTPGLNVIIQHESEKIVTPKKEHLFALAFTNPFTGFHIAEIQFDDGTKCSSIKINANQPGIDWCPAELVTHNVSTRPDDFHFNHIDSSQSNMSVQVAIGTDKRIRKMTLSFLRNYNVVRTLEYDSETEKCHGSSEDLYNIFYTTPKDQFSSVALFTLVDGSPDIFCDFLWTKE